MTGHPIKCITMRILTLGLVFLLMACQELYDPKRDTKLIQIPHVEHVINGKRYSINLYHSKSSLSSNFAYLEAVDTDGVAHYRTLGVDVGWVSDSAKVLFEDDGMVKIMMKMPSVNKNLFKDTLRFKPEWQLSSDWK